MIRALRQTAALVILIAISLGFRSYGPEHHWEISRTDPRIWLKFCEDKSFDDNDLPDGDPLAGSALTFDAVIDSVLNDFNGIASSYVVLADADRDADYATTVNADERTIDVCYTNFADLAGGKATLKGNASNWTGCTLDLATDLNKSAKAFIRTLTHELGHCLGLDHPQETEHAIMSYFADADIVRLQTDDKIGLTFLYPEDADKGKESTTLGLSCSTRK